jgi:hypothetical protein
LRAEALNEYLSTISQTSKDDFKCNLDVIEEEAAIYAGLMLKVRQAFGKAKDSALDASYTIWEEFDKEMPNIDNKISHITDSLNPLCAKLTEINALLSKINVYDFDRLLKTIQAISNLDIKSQKIIEFVVENYNKD